MSSDNDPTKKSASDWLARPEVPLPSWVNPVNKVARHLMDGDGLMWDLKGDTPGSLHFSVPAAWFKASRKRNDFRIPTALNHTDNGAEPFTRAVEGGKVLTMWLKPGVVSHHMHERTQRLCESLQDSFNVVPLEARLYIPSQKIIGALHDIKKEAGAMLLLATDADHVQVLQNAIYVHLLRCRENEKARIKKEASAPKHKLSAEGFTRFLDSHGTGFIEKNGRAVREVRVQDPMTAVADFSSSLIDTPKIIEKTKQGMFELTAKDDKGNPLALHWDADMLEIPAEASHLLLLRLNAHCRVSPSPEKQPLPPELLKQLTLHDDANRQFLTKGLHHELGTNWAANYFFDTPMGDILVLTTDAAHQAEKLHQAKQFITKTAAIVGDENRRWHDYLDQRHVDYRPPSSRG